jgi:hypothetical protein
MQAILQTNQEQPALAPDIDHPCSTISKGLPRQMWRAGVDILAPILAIGLFFGVFGGREVAAKLLASFAPVLKMGLAVIVPAILLVLISLVVRSVTGHRGATHSLVFALAATVAASLVCAGVGVDCWYGRSSAGVG